MDSVQLLEFEEKFARLSNQALTQFAKPYICITLYKTGNKEREDEASAVLDLIYTECVKRGIEKLYDMTFEAISKNPAICTAA